MKTEHISEHILEHILVEHISGYELFEMKSFEDLVNKSFMDYTALVEVVSHVSSLKISSVEEAIQMYHFGESNGINNSLKNFLELNSVKILHCDKIFKKFCKENEIEYKRSFNIYRGIKYNLRKILKKEIDKPFLIKSAHVLAKEKVGATREDNYVVFEGYEVEQLEKEIENISNNLKSKIHRNFPMFFNKNVDLLSMKEMINVDIKSDDIKSSDIKSIDKNLNDQILSNCLNFNQIDKKEINQLFQCLESKKALLEQMNDHFQNKMRDVVPNTREIVGDKIAVRMLHKAGGLSNLSMLPSSTIQLLGAEKALFQTLKSHSKIKKTPKFGYLFDLVSKSTRKGRLSRFIANKCAITSKIDSVAFNNNNEFGVELSKLCSKKAKALKTGEKIECTGDLLERVSKKLKNLESTEKVTIKPLSKIDSKSKNVKKSKCNSAKTVKK